MYIKQIVVATLACFALVNNATAANKTHVDDLQGAGKSRVGISAHLKNLNFTGNSLQSSVNYAATGTYSLSRYQLDYVYGITDKFDLAVVVPFANTLSVQTTYIKSPNTFVDYQASGLGDIEVQGKYKIFDKEQDKLSWIVGGGFIPSTAASDPGTPQITTNGVITTKGVTGKSGNGYTTTIIGTLVSIPSAIGGVYASILNYTYGSKTTAGVAYQRGSDIVVELGTEYMLNDVTTVTPFLGFVNTASSRHGTSTTAASSSTIIGVALTQDLSKSLSLQGSISSYTTSNVVTTYGNGDVLTLGASGYQFNISAKFFF